MRRLREKLRLQSFEVLHVPHERRRDVGGIPQELDSPGEETLQLLTVDERPKVRVVSGAKDEHVAELSSTGSAFPLPPKWLSDLRMPGTEDIGNNKTLRHSVKCSGATNSRVNAGFDPLIDFGLQSAHGRHLMWNGRLYIPILLLHSSRMAPMRESGRALLGCVTLTREGSFGWPNRYLGPIFMQSGSQRGSADDVFGAIILGSHTSCVDVGRQVVIVIPRQFRTSFMRKLPPRFQIFHQTLLDRRLQF